MHYFASFCSSRDLDGYGHGQMDSAGDPYYFCTFYPFTREETSIKNAEKVHS